LAIKAFEERLRFHARGQTSPTPKLCALPQQAPVSTDEVGVNRLQLKDNTIEPLAAEGRLPSHEMEVKSAEAHAAQRTN
jgi:hypothetical protein